MAEGPIRSVAIVGDGPAGTTLATLLAREGMKVGLFARGRPTGLVVGESLVPAIIPILRELDIEDEVRSYGVFKPGATFVLRTGEAIGFDFADTARRLPGYAFNVPRDRFDATLIAACGRSGARVFPRPARLERAPGAAGRVQLAASADPEVREFFNGPPDLIVDATGRARTVARLLDLPANAGDRRDLALFSHCEGIPLENEGHIHMDHLGHGWCWRIPLPGRVSLGVVVRPEVLAGYGSDATAQFDAYLEADPHLKKLTQHSRRISPVLKYDNYQLTTLRGVGDGWALVGDAFGFVDPIFSSGLLLAMDGARALARAVLAGTAAALRRYERRQLRHLEAWRRVVGYYYDGRLFDLIKLGHTDDPNWIGRIVNPHVGKRVSRILIGESTTEPYSRWLLDFVIARALPQTEPSALRIH
jgi:flavin-dependent dehydrogenase